MRALQTNGLVAAGKSAIKSCCKFCLIFIHKSCPTTCHRGTWEERYSSYSFSTSALDRGEWSVSRPSHTLAPMKGPQVPIVQEAGWAPELV
jgi:hypothetical protein